MTGNDSYFTTVATFCDDISSQKEAVGAVEQKRGPRKTTSTRIWAVEARSPAPSVAADGRDGFSPPSSVVASREEAFDSN